MPPRSNGSCWERSWGWTSPLYHSTQFSWVGCCAVISASQSASVDPVLEVVAEKIPATLQLGGAGLPARAPDRIPLGVMSAVLRGSVLDQIGRAVALIGQAAPSFWLGIMFIFFFAVYLGWVPPSGRQDWNSFVLPTITTWPGAWFLAGSLRLMRSAMLDTLDTEYIKLARAKGLPGRAIIWKHAFRNALIPPLTLRRRIHAGHPHGFHHHRAGVRVAGNGPIGGASPLVVGLPADPGADHHVHVG